MITPSEVETRTSGTGEPITVVAHGLGEGIEAARVWASGVRGTRLFPQFRGHGSAPAPAGPWSYDDLVQELRTVADPYGATRAIGASLGSAVLLRWLQQEPDRFDRVVLVLPTMYDQPRSRSTDKPLRHESPHYWQLLQTPPVTEPSRLQRVAAPVLLIGQRSDEEHPAWVAERVAGAFADVTVEILPAGGLLQQHRQRLREIIGGFLNS